MDMNQDWTQFAADAEVAHFGTSRLCKSHNALRASADFYRCRCEALQAVQHQMRDPERKMVCDILANGKTFATLNSGIETQNTNEVRR